MESETKNRFAKLAEITANTLRNNSQIPVSIQLTDVWWEGPQYDTNWWIEINEVGAYFGDSYQAALITAREGDWFIVDRDGLVTPAVRSYFDMRTQYPNWDKIEVAFQTDARLTRKRQNFEGKYYRED